MLSLPAGYSKFLFFLSKTWKGAVARNVVRLAAYAVGRTQIQPFHQVRIPKAPSPCLNSSYARLDPDFLSPHRTCFFHARIKEN